jgi:diadenosine tetraphosphate (Ap4A) HIT family hydrolase
MLESFNQEEGKFALEFFQKMVRVWKRRQKEEPQFAGICQHFIDQFQFEAEEMEKLLMRPTKPLARPDYLEWSKTLPKEGCMLCDWQDWQLVLKEYDHWVWVYSCAPYKKFNSMLIPKRHIEYMHEVNWKEFLDLTFIMKEMYEIFHTINDGSEYVWLWRTRDDNFDKEGTKKKGKRLSHLHIHFMPEASRFLDPALESDAHDEETFNTMVKAVENYGTRKTTN